MAQEALSILKGPRLIIVHAGGVAGWADLDLTLHVPHHVLKQTFLSVIPQICVTSSPLLWCHQHHSLVMEHSYS